MTSPSTIWGYIGISVWSFGILFVQLYNPFAIAVTIAYAIFYGLMYVGLWKHFFPAKVSNYLAKVFFASTFMLFWTDVIHLIFFLNGLNTTNNLFIIIGNIIVYALFFILFYTTIDTLNPSTVIPDPANKRMSFFLEITFPLIAAAGILLSTFSLYGNLLRIQIARGMHEASGTDTFIATISLSLLFTSLLTGYFEQWLATASKSSMAKLYIVEILAGLLITTLIIRS